MTEKRSPMDEPPPLWFVILFPAMVIVAIIVAAYQYASR